MTTDTTPPLRVYIASITGNTEVRKHIQRTLMILDGLGVPFKAIDITVRGNEEEKEYMREHSKKEGAGILPPQFFHNNDYLGNFSDFDEAVETNTLEEFLRLIPTDIPDATSSQAADESKSRETSVEGESSKVSGQNF
uniref:Uncharacterized protein n=1 Tax=Acrobeloides nanus TaxID=290746 RepID=A0A914DTR5_9BILA